MMKLDTYRYKKPHHEDVPKSPPIFHLFSNKVFVYEMICSFWKIRTSYEFFTSSLQQKIINLLLKDPQNKMMWLNKLLQFCIIMSFFSKKKLIDLFVHNKPVYSYIHCSQNRTVLCHERAWNKNNKRIKQFTINPIEIHFHTILQRNNISEVKKND